MATFQVPQQNQYFRSKGDFGEAIYRHLGSGKFERLDLINSFVPKDQRASIGNVGAQAGYATNLLKQTHGIDFASLPEYHLGDIQFALQRGELNVVPASDPNAFLSGLNQNKNSALGAGSITVDQTANPLPAGTTAPVETPPQAPQAPPQGVTTPTGTNTPTGYQGGSIVDFLKSTGKPTDFASRAAMAKQMGIQGYRGTAQQNTQMLQKLRSQPQQTTSQTQQNPQGGGQTSQTGQPIGQTTQNQPQQQPVDLAAEIKSIFSTLGIKMPTSMQSPVTSVADIYKQFSDNTNLFGTKKDIEELINKKTQEISDVNENPWMSEGLRQRKLEAINNKYDTRLSMLQATFTKADEDARFLTGKYLEQVHQNQQNTQDILFKGIDLAMKKMTSEQAIVKEEEHVREFNIRETDARDRAAASERRFEETLGKSMRQFQSSISEKKREFDLTMADKKAKEDMLARNIKQNPIKQIVKPSGLGALFGSEGLWSYSDPSTGAQHTAGSYQEASDLQNELLRKHLETNITIPDNSSLLNF